MDRSDDMNIFQNRLESFEVEHHVSKRRVSSTKKKPSSTVSWHHKNPTAEQLAKAGFYYKPTANSSDSVTCFLCNKSLDGWDADDNPALEHLAHVPDCGWAINICIEQRSQDPEAVEEDPLSEKMTEARLATFRDWWPHDGKRGWKCTLKRMVNAGWSYSPLADADDCVMCFYCGVSLDGWEPKDDPLEEHRRRAPHCQFFILKAISTNTKAVMNGKKGRTSRASRLSRMSTQSNLSLVSDEPSLMQADDTEAEEGDTVITTTSIASKTGKGRKKVTKATKVQRGGRKTTRQQEESMIEVPVPENTNLDVQSDELSAAKPSQEPQLKKKRGTKRVTKQSIALEANETITEVEDALPPQKAPRTRTAKKPPVETRDADGTETEIEDSRLQDNRKEKPKRGKKRTSDGLEKVESSVVLEEVSHVSSNVPKVKAKGRPKKAAKEQLRLSSEQSEIVQAELSPKGQANKNVFQVKEASHEATVITLPPKKKVTKPKKTKQAAANNIEESDLLSEKDSTEHEVPKIAPISSTSGNQARTKILDVLQPERDNKGLDSNARVEKLASPTSSPQSSDAENRLPSSRVSLASRPSLVAFPEPPSTTKRSPLGVVAAEPAGTTTPSASPSKRQINTSGIASSLAWTAIDLSKMYPLPPRADDPNADLELHDILQDAKPGLLTSEEKQMTVEEWVLWNAARAEEHMRGECERMIQRFEEEGGRAMRVLEGVECVS